MKHLIVFVLIISIQSAFAAARTDDPGNNYGSKGVPGLNEIGDIVNLTSGLSKVNIDNFSKDLCLQLSTSSLLGDSKIVIGEKLEDHVLRHLGITRETPDYQKSISSFWNKNAKDIICTIPDSVGKTPQHFIERAIDYRMHKAVFNKFLFLNRKTYPKNINFVVNYNGTKETVLDFVDNIIAQNNEVIYDISELKRIRRTLVKHFYAKNAADL